VAKKWNLVRKLFDYFEANSEDYWTIPEFNNGNADRPQDEFDGELESDEQEEEQSIFSAAYENVSYRDSTDDGVEGEIFDDSDPDHSELLHLGEQIDRRLAFHDSLASLWKIAGLGQAISIRHHEKAEPQLIEDSLQTITNWSKRLAENRQKLENLIDSIGGHVIPAPVGDSIRSASSHAGIINGTCYRHGDRSYRYQTHFGFCDYLSTAEARFGYF
jgi:hypothetical protein